MCGAPTCALNPKLIEMFKGNVLGFMPTLTFVHQDFLARVSFSGFEHTPCSSRKSTQLGTWGPSCPTIEDAVMQQASHQWAARRASSTTVRVWPETVFYCSLNEQNTFVTNRTILCSMFRANQRACFLLQATCSVNSVCYRNDIDCRTEGRTV